MMQQVLTIYCEIHPRSEDANAIFPDIPDAGAFTISEFIPTSLWTPLNARYCHSDELLALDIADPEDGWRYSFSAIYRLFQAGYAIRFDNEIFTSSTDLSNKLLAF